MVFCFNELSGYFDNKGYKHERVLSKDHKLFIHIKHYSTPMFGGEVSL